MLAGLTGTAVLATLSGPALALTEDQAVSYVQSMAADIEKTINSGRSDAQMYKAFEQLLNQYADMDTIARFALGPAARSASSGELSAYTAAFRTYLSKKYGARFREFIGGDIQVQGARKDKRAVIVSARAKPRGQSAVAVDFHVSDRNGKVFNVILEGVNLLTTERTEITSLLDQQGGSISNLTAELKRRS
ncbi:ABC transporter substrate-binding protein [Mangrovicoccus sp. HB182678]|uniref:ABC transporter substrate-binding protein n=2 Tax=Mangrovicoccus algicola TaxID=2771008 RepID=A0A8J7CJ52_9RHOB|nr:ABC transporter substrate-binding protein [Mangrovicoccus algicola]MBE3640395.1 ABC transporter substrate-binding protein [Mangrovicoccus algicola]